MPWNPLRCVCIVSRSFIGYDLDPNIKKELDKEGVLEMLERENTIVHPSPSQARKLKLHYPYLELKLYPLT